MIYNLILKDDCIYFYLAINYYLWLMYNKMSAPYIQFEAPTAPYGFSKYLKSLVDTIAERFNNYVNSMDSTLNHLIEVRDQGFADAEDARGVLNTKIDTKETELKAYTDSAAQSAASNRMLLSQSLKAEINTERNRIADLEAWKTANTDELSKEVDKAINEKVSQTAFDTIKADLENADSAISQNLANAITARSAADSAHDVKFARMEKFVNTLLSTYTLYDAQGNEITEFSDVTA